MRGRKPKPLNLLKAQGNRRDINNMTNPEAESCLPDAPEFLTDAEKEVFNNVAGKLHDLGIMTVIEVDLITLYAVDWVLMLECREQVAKEGKIVETQMTKKPHPAILIGNQAKANCLKYMEQTGLTPSARRRLATNPTTRKDLSSELADLAKQRMKTG